MKDKKVGEGTYAVVYQGHEFTTKKRIAIKKIKVGQFKDGLDMSAVREVKFLKELQHQNVIAVSRDIVCPFEKCLMACEAIRCIFFKDKPESRSGVLGCRS